MNNKADILGSLFLLVLGVAFSIKAYLIPLPLLQQDVNTTPAFFPVLVGLIFVILALIQLTNSILSWKRSEKSDLRKLSVRRMAPALILLPILLAYIILIQVFGWFLCSVLMTVAVIAISASALGKQMSIWKNALFAVGFSVVIFILFNHLLGVPLPSGIWSLEILLLGE
ncbi:MAG: tripartite tricarboxylate transporter TctB family protein [Deltaproteobacteria bacterium]|nr:tripartite tricarboxylate transporter TctB family protein [Deltaproteobacteria bacterium]